MTWIVQMPSSRRPGTPSCLPYLFRTGSRSLRFKLTGSKSKPTVSAKFLCDTGNLGRSLISEKFAQTLKWESHPCKHSIKSAQGNRVTITGETNPVSFVIQGHEQPFQWRFLIIRDLCAPGVFVIDFFNHFDVAIQMSKSGASMFSSSIICQFWSFYHFKII